MSNTENKIFNCEFSGIIAQSYQVNYFSNRRKDFNLIYLI